MKPHHTLAAATVLAALTLPTAATSAIAGDIVVTGAWSRPVAPGLTTGVAYFTVRNASRTPDQLMDASTPVAKRASLHQSMSMNGMMSMTPLTAGLSLPAGGAATLAPGGYHLMLEGLSHGLKLGEHYPLTLKFAHAAPLTVNVAVQATPPR